MDYIQQPLIFKIKKLLRYIKLYGMAKTLVKVRGQYHMRKSYKMLPVNNRATGRKQHVGIMGCGNFGFSNVAYYLKKNYGQIIKGVMDVDINRAASLYEQYGAAYYTTEPDKILDDRGISLVYIASNHASHAEYAVEALKRNKSVHIEKPHAVSISQLVRLCETMENSKGSVRLGFNRPSSQLGQRIIEVLKQESGTAMINWFVAGHQIEGDHWYFAAEEGGRILGNLCHWIDLAYHMVPFDRYPITIIPTKAKKADCDISVSFVFGEGSIATITFSAKGHTFEGVRESLNAHKGNVLIELKDFKHLRIDSLEKIEHKTLRKRDHGHEYAVQASFKMVENPSLAADTEYVWNTGYLALKVKEALEKNAPVIVDAFDVSFPAELLECKLKKVEADHTKS